jgi:hypothetical protein
MPAKPALLPEAAEAPARRAVQAMEERRRELAMIENELRNESVYGCLSDVGEVSRGRDEGRKIKSLEKLMSSASRPMLRAGFKEV